MNGRIAESCQSTERARFAIIQGEPKLSMRDIRSRDELDLGSPRPLCYCGEPDAAHRPSSFSFADFNPHLDIPYGRARLYYRLGWTAVVFWNSERYFTDEILTFDAMIGLIRERFDKLYLRAPITRVYEE